MMKKMRAYLAFAGAIPFLLGALLTSLNINMIPVLGNTLQVIAVYGLVICTFMAGVHWGQHLHLSDKNKWVMKLPVISNAVTLYLWVAFILFSLASFIIALMVGFVTLLWIDFQLNKSGVISDGYFSIRKWETVIVLISLLLMRFV